jgi:hypothetical protein
MGVEEAVGDLENALDESLNEALGDVSVIVANEAASNHEFGNQSGELQGSIHGNEATGRLSSGNLEVEVSAEAEYASYVDEKTPFLEPAYERADNAITRRLDDALSAATEKANW